MHNATKRAQIDTERSKTRPQLMQNAAKRDPNWFRTQQTGTQIDAERSKTGPKLMQNAEKRAQIDAERNKTAPNSIMIRVWALKRANMGHP